MTTSEGPTHPPPGATITASGDASAANGGIANTGIMGDLTINHHPVAIQQPVSAVQVGQPPALASAFQPRQDLKDKVLAARRRGDDVVLAQPDDVSANAGLGTRLLAGGGGVGKSQLAAWFAHDAAEHGTDLVMWVRASSPDQVINTYARAAARVDAPGADGTDPIADAKALLELLHTTDRTWLIVLDDVTDPAHLSGWWPPHRPTGWTLATTRLQDATLASSGRQKIDVDVYTPSESVAYLTDRFTDANQPYLLDASAPELAAALGHLPLALSHAAAYMINQEEGCAVYLDRYTNRRERLVELMPADADPDAYGRPVAVTLLLNLEAADTTTPEGLARPALAIAALLDPTGHPDSLWATTAFIDYLSDSRAHATDQPVTADQAWKTLRLLHRYGLLTHTPIDGNRAVRIHALTARATRETTETSQGLAHSAANALLQLWPSNDNTHPELAAALRTNTTTLASLATDLLWQPSGHPLLYRAGTSYFDAGLPGIAVTYWNHTTEQAGRLLGDEHLHTITARANLAASYWQAGRTTEAIGLEEKVLADRKRLLGDEHLHTITARANLAASYWQAGRTTEAIGLEEKVLADRKRLLGDEHLHTITARANLAASYWQAGRTTEAITHEKQVLADRKRLLGDEHPDTLTARANLAASYLQARRTTEAIIIEEKVLADAVRVLGNEHLHTITARANLAVSYRQAGRTTEAIILLEKALADRERLLGNDHPLTAATDAALQEWV
ncbi:tetratricopeptide repeat protein [Verrucosispora sp. WMMC514]|uniref:tetratricopeptide repeat protein n=1 Tax=Verrucosispora sp. WMMC514 TaxID=3015156 RepID=UPI00248C9506|nr:tetratricopeptide repeat protein [Verrucosispora sp. WMMC514]WBB93428.1 tetratricopeptide repeat protein [Verrucosispora sp. WMMC514]